MGVMRELGDRGDTETHWNPNDPESTRIAKETFKKWTDELGGLAFTNEDGDWTKLNKFKPNAQEIILTRPIAGG